MSNHHQLLADAGVFDARDQERLGRYLSAACTEESLRPEDILAVANTRDGFTIIHKQAIFAVGESGIFRNKRINVRRVCPIASIANLRTSKEGFKPPDLALTATDRDGATLFKAKWTLSLVHERQAAEARRESDRLFKAIATVMDDVGAPSRHSFAAAASKSGALLDWSTEVVKAAGVPLTDDAIERHANMAAGGIGFMVFLRLGAAAGIDDLNRFYPGGKLPGGTPLATFDGLYAGVVTRLGNAAVVDEGIDEFLAQSWGEFVRGCRETYA